MPEHAGAAPESAADDTSPFLTDFIGDALGDPSSFEESAVETPAGSDADAASAQLAERPDAPAATPGSPEGTTDVERTGAQPADATSLAPDASTGVVPAPVADPNGSPDPLAGSSPFSYTVNGQPRSVEGITVLAEHGGIVTAEGLNFLQQRLSERDSLFERSREQFDTLSSFERLSAWHSRDEQGNPTVLPGLQGLTEMRVQLARVLAENEVMTGLLQDPSKLSMLLIDDAEGKLTINAEKLRLLAYEAKEEQDKRERMVRSVLGRLQTQAPAAAPTATSEPAEDVAPHAPQIIASAAGVGAKVLTAEDKASLAAQLPRYIRPATDADRRNNPSLVIGKPLVDYSFVQVVQERVKLREGMSAAVSAAQTAAAENQRKLAAAARPAAPAPAAPAPRPAAPAQTTRAKDADDAWDLMESLTSGRAFRATQ